jgi:hypothetical protein
MLSKKIFNTLKNTSRTQAVVGGMMSNFSVQQRALLPYMRLAQFGSCGTGGGCGSGKCLTKFRDDIQ